MRRFRVLYESLALYCSLSLLAILCLGWSVVALPLYFVLPEERGTAVGRRGAMLGFRFYAWSLSVTRAMRGKIRRIELSWASSTLLVVAYLAMTSS